MDPVAKQVLIGLALAVLAALLVVLLVRPWEKQTAALPPAGASAPADAGSAASAAADDPAGKSVPEALTDNERQRAEQNKHRMALMFPGGARPAAPPSTIAVLMHNESLYSDRRKGRQE